jgi:hypothetical protein
MVTQAPKARKQFIGINTATAAKECRQVLGIISVGQQFTKICGLGSLDFGLGSLVTLCLAMVQRPKIKVHTLNLCNKPSSSCFLK